MEMLLEIISFSMSIPATKVKLNRTQNFQGYVPSRAACHNVDKSFQCQYCVCRYRQTCKNVFNDTCNVCKM